MNHGAYYRAIVDTVVKDALASGWHPYIKLCQVMNMARLDDFDRSILLMNLYYRRNELPWHLPKFIIE